MRLASLVSAALVGLSSSIRASRSLVATSISLFKAANCVSISRSLPLRTTSVTSKALASTSARRPSSTLVTSAGASATAAITSLGDISLVCLRRLATLFLRPGVMSCLPGSASVSSTCSRMTSAFSVRASAPSMALLPPVSYLIFTPRASKLGVPRMLAAKIAPSISISSFSVSTKSSAIPICRIAMSAPSS